MKAHLLSWRAFTLVGIGVIAAYPFLSGHETLIYLGVGIYATLGTIAGAARVGPRAALPWVVFAIFTATWVLGDAIFMNTEALQSDDMAFPSPADIPYLLAYPIGAAGLMILVRRTSGGRTPAALLDGSMVALAFGLMSWVFVHHTAIEEGMTAIATIVSVLYPVFDIVLIALVVRLVFVDHRNVSTRFLLLSVSLLLVADVVYQFMIIHNTYYSVADLLWLGSYVFIGAASLHPHAATSGRRNDRAPADATRGRMGLLAAAALVAPIILITQLDKLDAELVAATAVTAAAMIGLVLARLGLQMGRTQVVLDGLHENEAILRDELDARRKAERSLKEREAFIREVLDSIPAHAAVLDATGSIITVNRSWTEFMTANGGSDDTCGVGTNYLDVCDRASGPGAEQAHQVAARIRDVLAGDLQEHRLQYECSSPGGERWFNVEMASLRAGHGMVMAHFDVSERTFLEQQLLHSHKLEAVGRLAGGIAHDFNNVLSVIMSYAELARDDVPDDVKGDIEEILKAGRRASDLVRQLLTFARREPVRRRLIDPTSVVSEIEGLLRVTLADKATLRVSAAEDCPSLRMDRAQLEQILMNFAANARDAMEVGAGTFSIDLEPCRLDRQRAAALGLVAGDYLMLRASDDGSGIAKEALSRIFEPFYSTKERERGTGLGLATVHGIVTRSGGSVSAESEVGVGTTFTVLLPAAAETEEVLDDGDRVVLVLDDEEPVRRAVARMLTSQGFRVLTAGNAAEAHTLFARHGRSIDLLLTDVVMPLTTGPELVRSLSDDEGPPNVLYMSGYSDEHLDALGDDPPPLLPKPFDEVELAAAVEAALRDARPERLR